MTKTETLSRRLAWPTVLAAALVAGSLLVPIKYVSLWLVHFAGWESRGAYRMWVASPDAWAAAAWLTLWCIAALRIWGLTSKGSLLSASLAAGSYALVMLMTSLVHLSQLSRFLNHIRNTALFSLDVWLHCFVAATVVVFCASGWASTKDFTASDDTV